MPEPEPAPADETLGSAALAEGGGLAATAWEAAAPASGAPGGAGPVGGGGPGAAGPEPVPADEASRMLSVLSGSAEDAWLGEAPQAAEPADDFHMSNDAESKSRCSTVGELVLQEIEQILGEFSTPRFGVADKGPWGRASDAGRGTDEAGVFAEVLAMPPQRLGASLESSVGASSRQPQLLFGGTVESSIGASSIKGSGAVGVFYATSATVGGFAPITADDELLMQDILDAAR